MILSILRQLSKSLLSKVADGFVEIAKIIGQLNNKITVVENECSAKFETLDSLDKNFKKLIPETMLTMSQDELEAYVEMIVQSESR